MKKTYPGLILVLLLCSLNLPAQDGILLKNGTIRPQANITDAFINQFNTAFRQKPGNSYVLIQFKKIPSASQRKVLSDAGINLIQYIPHNAYLAQITKMLHANSLQGTAAISITAIKPEYKISQGVNVKEAQEVIVSIFQTESYDNAITVLTSQGFIITKTDQRDYQSMQVKLPAGRLKTLAEMPFIQSIEPLPPPPVALNFKSRNTSRANILQSKLPGAYNLTGEGVRIAIGELGGGFPDHVDYNDREVIVGFNNIGFVPHTNHVHGIAGGAGLVNELYTGHAPGATLLAMDNASPRNNITISTQDFQITNNSWGSGAVCYYESYTQNFYAIDKQALDYPYLQHVFASGNSGNTTCKAYPPGYGTIFSGFQSAKSLLTVGNTLANGQINGTSSRGPSNAGLLKPEIVATGTSVISTIGNNTYGTNTGTSMSTPAIAGGLALLYQRYKQLNNGTNPSNALMKAIICNTANDLGNVGPDFTFGFGSMNLLRAVKALDNRNYILDNTTDQISNTHTIPVPAGTAKLKVMLYWQDQPASTFAARFLVNDLDLEINTPQGSTVLPYILDTLPANVANPAVRGADHINNIEQVVIDNPAAGNYTIKIKGTEIGQEMAQNYVVVYDLIPNDITLTFPYGGEGMNPGETHGIQWEAAGDNISTFTLQFSSDSGSTWQNINTNVAANTRYYDWTVPATATATAMIKVIRNADAKTSSSRSFVIAAVPVLSLTSVQCPGFISLQWTASAGVTDYEIMMVKNGKMVSVDSTAATNYVMKNLSEETTYWVTVRPRINGKAGRRAIAVSRIPSNGNCAGTISDNDLKLSAIVAPLYGRKYTSDSLTTNTSVTVRIYNLDDQPVNDYSIQYSMDNGPWVVENVVNPIPAYGFFNYSFTAKYDFSQMKTYTLKAVVKAAGDINAGNDTLTYIIRNVNNPVIDLSQPVKDWFDQSPLVNWPVSTGAFVGADRFDYKKISGSGNFSIIDKAVSATGGKGFKLKRSLNGDQYVTATYNLSAYDTGTAVIGFEFTYSKSSTGVTGNDRLWVRGSDTSIWIPVMDLDPGPFATVTNTTITGVRLNEWLRSGDQNFSSSTQVRWSQESSPSDYFFDSVTLFDARKDIELVSIDSFLIKNCNMGAAVPVRITIRNRSGETLNNVPVGYRIDGGAFVEETIPVLFANETRSYAFTHGADLSAADFHTIEVRTNLNGDRYGDNNIKSITIRNQALINSFPYLQNFEQGNGGWYAEGANSSWEYGIPASTKISGAASGTKAWKTRLAGNHNNLETSFLYSPCLAIGNLNRPTISFSMAFNMDSCRMLCDAVRLQYSTNNITWRTISTISNRNYKQWQSFTAFLPDTVPALQLRFWVSTDVINTYEGIAIDDVHIYDSTVAIYDIAGNSAPVSQTLSGNQWTDFTANGKIIASINSYGQNVGATSVQTFLRNTVGNFHGQYFLNRSFSLQSSNTPDDSIGIRLYYLNTETENLVFAKNCAICIKPIHAYKLGISQYNTEKVFELNGDPLDNLQGNWSFIPPGRLKIVPYLQGYYAEFKVKDFSELYLNNGGYDNNSPLPVQIPEFTAHLSPSGNAELKWATAAEINIDHFDIEEAAGNEAFSNKEFEKLDDLGSHGHLTTAQQYSFTADGVGKKGVHYYRIKAVDEFGNYSYTKAQPVVFTNELKWTIAPSHSSGLYNLIYQVNEGENLELEIFNSVGVMIKKEKFTGIGFIGRHEIDLERTAFAKGIYLVRVHTKNETKTFRIVKW